MKSPGNAPETDALDLLRFLEANGGELGIGDDEEPPAVISKGLAEAKRGGLVKVSSGSFWNPTEWIEITNKGRRTIGIDVPTTLIERLLGWLKG